MKRILFICQANVARSQMAEGFYNSFTHTNEAMSAGVEDFAEKYHFRPTREIVDVMAEKGIDISEQRITVLTPGMCEQVARIVVLCAQELCPSFVLHNPKTEILTVDDPFKQSVERLRYVRDQIETIVKGLL